MKLLIVGGEPSLVRGNLQRNLEAQGFEICWHHGRSARPTPQLPAGCEGVLVIKDMCRHGMSAAAKDLAKAARVPYAAIPRKWAKAWPIIRDVWRSAGILPEPPAPEVPRDSVDDAEPLDCTEDVRQAVILILEDSPDLVSRPADIEVDVRALLDLPDEVKILRTVQQAASAVRNSWREGIPDSMLEEMTALREQLEVLQDRVNTLEAIIDNPVDVDGLRLGDFASLLLSGRLRVIDPAQVHVPRSA
tara:strand:- start:304 stop:1044 length:741 start_codon:yes stop_codon:yes gene_type:complete